MENVTIEKAKKTELNRICDLLKKSKLPTQGINKIVGTTLVAKIQGVIVGCAAIEIYNNSSLLRSVAVDSSFQRKGIGEILTNDAIKLSEEKSLTNLFLLTETAEVFFQKLGFDTIERSKVPVEIQGSEEFSTICPSSASVLKLNS